MCLWIFDVQIYTSYYAYFRERKRRFDTSESAAYGFVIRVRLFHASLGRSVCLLVSKRMWMSDIINSTMNSTDTHAYGINVEITTQFLVLKLFVLLNARIFTFEIITYKTNTKKNTHINSIYNPSKYAAQKTNKLYFFFSIRIHKC